MLRRVGDFVVFWVVAFAVYGVMSALGADGESWSNLALGIGMLTIWGGLVLAGYWNHSLLIFSVLICVVQVGMLVVGALPRPEWLVDWLGGEELVGGLFTLVIAGCLAVLIIIGGVSKLVEQRRARREAPLALDAARQAVDDPDKLRDALSRAAFFPADSGSWSPEVCAVGRDALTLIIETLSHEYTAHELCRLRDARDLLVGAIQRGDRGPEPNDPALSDARYLVAQLRRPAPDVRS